MSGRIYVRSDSFHQQNVQHLAGLSCKGELHAFSSPPAYSTSTVAYNATAKSHSHRFSHLVPKAYWNAFLHKGQTRWPSSVEQCS
jgi:hypothetical protein